MAKRLHKELEWIPLMAMRKERTERYRSASELADDIENYLKGNPLMAGPLTVSYRFKKFVLQNKRIFAAVTVVTAVLVLGAFISIWQAVRATKAKRTESSPTGQLFSSMAAKRTLLSSRIRSVWKSVSHGAPSD